MNYYPQLRRAKAGNRLQEPRVQVMVWTVPSFCPDLPPPPECDNSISCANRSAPLSSVSPSVKLGRYGWHLPLSLLCWGHWSCPDPMLRPPLPEVWTGGPIVPPGRCLSSRCCMLWDGRGAASPSGEGWGCGMRISTRSPGGLTWSRNREQRRAPMERLARHPSPWRPGWVPTSASHPAL